MLKAIPKRCLSWDFTVMDRSQPVADIDVSWWREKGQLTVEGTVHKVYREGLASGAFILESTGLVLARAEKTSAFRRSFTIDHAGKQYTLRAKSAFRRDFVLLEGAGAKELGSLSPEGVFRRRARVDFPEHLRLAVTVFMIWLAVILWKRESDSTAT
jgi:hypothetical protein